MNVQIIGGRKDGEFVPYQGPSLRIPYSNPVNFTLEIDSIPKEIYFTEEHFVLRRGFDGELYYVLYQASKAWG